MLQGAGLISTQPQMLGSEAAIDRRDFLSDDMVRIPGGTFRMGSDRHYPEEAPAHRVSVDEFLIDRTPVIRACCRICSMPGRSCFRRPRGPQVSAIGTNGGNS
jgi:hypothetical protein